MTRRMLICSLVVSGGLWFCSFTPRAVVLQLGRMGLNLQLGEQHLYLPERPILDLGADTQCDVRLHAFQIPTDRSSINAALPNGRFRYQRAAVPLSWTTAALTGMLVGLLYRDRSTRQNRLRGGLCQQCGYDLRASSLRCPECGRQEVS